MYCIHFFNSSVTIYGAANGKQMGHLTPGTLHDNSFGMALRK